MALAKQTVKAGKHIEIFVRSNEIKSEELNISKH